MNSAILSLYFSIFKRCIIPFTPLFCITPFYGFHRSIVIPATLPSTLTHYIAVIHSRLASNTMVSSLFDRISTCWIVHPLPDALSGTWSFNYPIIVLILLLLLIALRSLSLSSELIFLQFDLKISSIISITCSYLLFTIIEAKHSIAAS